MLFTAFCFMCLLFSCEHDDSDIIQPTNHVLLVYMGGDNNLSDETYEKLDAICTGWKAHHTNHLLIYMDANNATPSLIEIIKENGSNTKKIIENYEEENSASSEVFARVVQKVKTLYPAQSYGLIVFSHASGWLPEGSLNRPKSVIIDQKREMELKDFANAIPDNMLDYIVFEACFMSGIEVAYELKDKADYIVASAAEIVSPGFTPTYPYAINRLFENGHNLTGFTDDVFGYFNAQQDYKNSGTFSVIKTSKLDELARFVRNNCDLNKEVNIKDIQRFDRYSYILFFDFEDYYSRLLETEIQQQELKELISNCVIHKVSTKNFMIQSNGFEIKKYSGLTTYIKQERFPVLNEKYKDLEWSKALTD